MDSLLDAKTSSDVEEIIRRLGDRIRWVPFGENPGNFGIISMGCDPYDGITERCTNSMDAIVELQVELNPTLRPCKSPREVIERVYEIKGGNLRNTSDEELRELSKDIKVRFLDSDDARAPTIEITDRGIGQHPTDFPNTLLGLNRDYKVSKFYLIGSFGQGGQTSFANCKFGIVISRKSPKLLGQDQPDAIGWSIVRYRDPSTKELLYKRGLWEYCVDESGKILQVPTTDIRRVFDHGTIIKLIEYTMPKGTSDALQPSGSAWGYLSQSLFDPILPIRLYEGRARYQNRNRPLSGLAVRLWAGGKGEKVKVLNNSYPLDMGKNGRITINYWALKPLVEYGEQAKWRDIKKGFVSGNAAIFVTLNGQRHAVEQNTFLRDQANLAYSYDHIIVQVDCDELTNFAKKELLSTTRDRLREGDIKESILSELAQILRNDRNILAFENERKNEILTARTKKDTSRIRALVGRYISKNPELSQLIQTTGHEKQEAEIQKKEHDEDESEEEIREEELVVPELKPVPTFLRIANKRDPIRVEKGGNCLIRLETDANDPYLEGDNKHRFRCLHQGGFTQEKGSSKLRNGKISYYVSCNSSTRVGTKGTIAFELDLPDKSCLRVQRPITCVAPIQRKTTKGESKLREPRIECVRKGDDLWNKLEYDETNVGEVRIAGADSMIVVSLGNKHLTDAMTARSLQDNVVSSVEDKYSAGIAYYLLLREINRRRNKQGTAETQEPESGELDRLAQTAALLSLPSE